jgi:hypothetical protein
VARQTIKRVAMQALAERGLAKADGRFKDVWNMVSRGALFAFVRLIAAPPFDPSLRAAFASVADLLRPLPTSQRDELAGRVLGMRDILAVVEGHLDLYLRPASIEQG